MQDFRFAIRILLRNPGFSALVILCLTLGIGSTTAVFSWIEGILLKPYPMVAHEDRMFALTGTDRNGRTDVSWPDFADLRRSCTLIDTFIAEHIGGVRLSIGDRAEQATGSVVSANYFDALGIRPVLGRTFEPAEDTGSNAHPVAVISYRAWKDRYRGDPAIIGRVQRLNGIEHTIIGVMPEGFAGTFVGYSWQFWVPASMEENFEGGGYKLEDRGARWIEGFAFLKPGVTQEQAQAEIDAAAKRLAAAYPDTDRGRGFKLYPLWQTPFNNAGTLLPLLRVSLVVAFLVLAIACANVGNLLLVRSFARRHEMAVRLSVGAGKWRLLKQLVTESAILSGLAATGGFFLAYWCRNLITLLSPPPAGGIVIHLPAEMDARVLALSAAVCLIATVLFGLVPAFEARKIDLAAAVKAESGGVVGGRGKARIRSALVMAQVALSFILLVGAGLLVASMRQIGRADLGLSRHGVLLSSVDLVSAGYDATRIRNFQDLFVDRVQSLAGVESAAWSRSLPFSFRGYSTAPIAVDGFAFQPGEQPMVEYNEVAPGFLATIGTPLVSGREFTRADNQAAPPVAVVNETMVQRFWRGENPVGKRLQVKGRWMQVVGVVRNSKYSSLLEAPHPFFYTPLRQGSTGGQNILIRTRLGPESMARALTREIKSIDANLAIGEVIPVETMVDRRTWSQRAAVTVLAIFSGMALLLAAIGLYGVMSYSVSQSRRELGLRMALGADAAELLRIVVSHGLTLTAAGAAAGAAIALLLTRLMGDLLYKVNPRDPASFGWAAAVMIVVALMASLVPGLRAARTDPVRALRD